MATIIRGSGEGKELSATYTFSAGNGATVDMGEDHSYRYVNASNVYNQGINVAHGTIGTCRQQSHRSSYGGGGKSSTIDTGNNHRKAVFVGGAQSGSGDVGGGQRSSNGSSWTNCGTGIYTDRYFRAWSECNDDSSSISYGYIGVIDLGY